MFQIYSLSQSRRYLNHVVTVLMVLFFVTGCMAPHGQKSWGDNSGWSVDKERLFKAAYNALVDPQTLIPAAGALAFSIDNWDRRVSDHVSRDNPVFGSQNNAEYYSDYILWSLIGETVLTGLYVPDEQTGNSNLKTLFVEGASIGGSVGISGILEYTTHRTRPNGNPYSFPSEHASASFAASTLSNRNLESINMSDGLRTSLQVGNILLASSVAWSRVEAKKHFPSDVLAGAALGHFMSAFIYDGFMNQDDGKFEVMVLPYRDGVTLSFGIPF